MAMNQQETFAWLVERDKECSRLEVSVKELVEALERLVSEKEPNGYPLWFNRAVHKCAQSRSLSGCDYEDLCNEHHDIAKGGFKDCEKYVQEFIANLLKHQ